MSVGCVKVRKGIAVEASDCTKRQDTPDVKLSWRTGFSVSAKELLYSDGKIA